MFFIFFYSQNQINLKKFKKKKKKKALATVGMASKLYLQPVKWFHGLELVESKLLDNCA